MQKQTKLDKQTN